MYFIVLYFILLMSMEAPLFACVHVGGRIRGTQPVCRELWTQEERQISANCQPMDGLGNLREEVALSGIVDVLSWRHAFATSQDPNFLRP
jgi:hypothetical protein